MVRDGQVKKIKIKGAEQGNVLVPHQVGIALWIMSGKVRWQVQRAQADGDLWGEERKKIEKEVHWSGRDIAEWEGMSAR